MRKAKLVKKRARWLKSDRVFFLCNINHLSFHIYIYSYSSIIKYYKLEVSYSAFLLTQSSLQYLEFNLTLSTRPDTAHYYTNVTAQYFLHISVVIFSFIFLNC